MTIEKLRELGANVDEGIERCLNDENFYLMLVPDALKRERYEELEEKIRQKDLAAAFESAHALKGVLANLSLTPLQDVVGEITEHLRAKDDMDYDALIRSMWSVYNKFEE